MNRLLLALWLLQAGPQGAGFVTGIVRSANGTPAGGVRVYAITYRDAVESQKAPAAFESLIETDATGKYRLELPPGRYLIASGSVASPTYFPGTTDTSAARVITVATNEVVSGIDFGTFVPANRAPGGITFSLSIAPPANGVLSGTLRYQDGQPAFGVRVTAIPSPLLSQAAVANAPTRSATYVSAGGIQVMTIFNTTPNASPITDFSGHYRLENLGPGTYYIVAGFSDAPMYYPGTTDQSKAKPVTVTNNSNIDKLDFEIQRPLPGVTVIGTILMSANASATGATVRIRSRVNATSGFPAALPLRNSPKETRVAADGTFTFNDVFPGSFAIDVTIPGIANQTQDVVVTSQPINSLLFRLAIATINGRLLLEDGSPIPNPRVFGDVILTKVDNPNSGASTILPISTIGTFTRLHERGEYRFYLDTLPEEYEIKSMQFGTTELTKENLKISGDVPVDIEIRVVKRSPGVDSGARVSGTVLDAVSGMPGGAERVSLCCRTSGPFQRFSASIMADGSFEVAGIPPGKYTPTIQVPADKPNLYLVENELEIGNSPTTLRLSTTPRFGQITVTIVSDGTLPYLDSTSQSLILTSPSGRVRIVTERASPGAYQLGAPMGGRYNVALENLPAGYVVKSITGDATPVTTETVDAPPVTILIERKP